jgi:hypothetical protein
MSSGILSTKGDAANKIVNEANNESYRSGPFVVSAIAQAGLTQHHFR